MKRWIYLAFSIVLMIASLFFFFVEIDIELAILETTALAFLFISFAVLASAIVVITIHHKQIQINNLQNRLKAWTQLSYHVSQVGDEVFNELPVGVLVLGDDELIKWANNFAVGVFGQSAIGKDIAEISEDIPANIAEGINEFTIAVGKDKFDIIYNKELNSAYFFNVTKREEIIEKYHNRVPAVGLIYLDNLDEALAGLDVSEQSTIKGEYLGIIADWVSEYDGFLKTFSDERLVMNIYRENLDKMIQDEFTVLERIRDVSELHNVKVTVSIGIASWDVEYELIGSYAQSAVELAERRGGDQVVINIQNQKIAYFGAKQDASATHSKVNTRVNAQTLRELVDKSSNVLIMSHMQSDTDAFGSMIAMLQMIRSHNPDKAKVVFDIERVDPTVTKISQILTQEEPDFYEYLVTSNEAVRLINDNTLVIILDTQSPKIVSSPEVFEKAKNLAIIDHHRSSADNPFEAVFSYIEPYASSTIELLVELIPFYNRDILITPLEASVMYAGLVVDTNNFLNRIGTRTFEVASTLREFGADMVEVNLWLRKDKERLLEINKLLSHVETFLDRFAFSVSEEIYQDRVLLAQVADEMLQIDGVDAAFTITYLAKDVVGVSARSIQHVNVQMLMEEIGGGGHLTGAAAQIKGRSVHEVYLNIKHLLDLEYGGDGEEMEIILLEDVKNRGKADEVITVASGYGNYLIKNKKAILATEENLAQLNLKLEDQIKREQQHLELMKTLKKEIDSKSVTVSVQIGHDGKMFGSVTTKQIVEAFERQNQIVLDRKKVQLIGEVNSVGIYTAVVTLYKDIEAQFDVHVVEK
ncbi:MAG: 50S ribosomal protein L9 [Acholeplasmataceae bacterium]|jgi:ribosomal protein L9